MVVDRRGGHLTYPLLTDCDKKEMKEMSVNRQKTKKHNKQSYSLPNKQSYWLPAA